MSNAAGGSADQAPASYDPTILLAEIKQEVERRRASGELPADLERELDRTFAEFAPVDAIDADFDSIVAKIERSSVIDVRPSVVSAYPGAAQMKQVIAKATAFYVRHVATQASGLFQAVARALRLLGERVDDLERQRGSGVVAHWRQAAGQPDVEWRARATDGWEDFVIQQLGAPEGRVLHAEAADGRLVRALVAAGYDAYGVEPSEATALAASDVVPDIRAVGAMDHLRTLPPGSLGGLVLSGFVERLDLAALVELAELAGSRLLPGRGLVVISAHPDQWGRTGPPLAVDLAPGRPVHPETWQALLGRAGLVDLATERGPRTELAALRVDASPEWAACQENFARLAEAVLGPVEFAVGAHRPS